MIHEANDLTVPYILSNSAQKAYEKIKELIRKIFAIIKNEKKQQNLKEEFYSSYIDFARKLDAEGFNEESNSYLSICDMYYDLMDRPHDLISHESFFTDLFEAFDRILSIKINKKEIYDKEYAKFLIYKGHMEEYYYTEVALPSEYYDEEVCKEIISHLSGGLEDE